jgi:hypothetical protein
LFLSLSLGPEFRGELEDLIECICRVLGVMIELGVQYCYPFV